MTENLQPNNPNLVNELKRLNRHISELRNSGNKFMLYSANPAKFAFMNFLSGIFHSLGSLFGYIVVFGAIVFLLSKVNLQGLMTKWLETTLGQINWEKVMPTYEMPQKIDLDKLNLKQESQDIYAY